MILRILAFLLASSLSTTVGAEPAPEITVLTSGYNLLVKLPCIDCPFLYQDASSSQAGLWKTRDDDNALLLNISLPFASLSLDINTTPLLSSSSSSPLLRIHAPQVLLDTSTSALADLIASNSLDATNSAALGISYELSLHRLASPINGLVFQFDVREAWTDALSTPTTIQLAHPEQKVLEVVMLRRPLYSAGDRADQYEIVRVGLVPRSAKFENGLRWVNFHDYGEKGTSSHYMASTSDFLMQSGAWSLCVFALAIIALFVVVGVFCVFWCGGMDEHEYERAQTGKRRTGKSDMESGRGRFLTAEELGLRSGARVVGVGKSD